MARYIDADKLSEYITTNYCKNCDIYDGEKCLACGMNDALNYIETFNTADVVPKSEVDLYKKQVDELEDELASTYDKLENAKAEVAMEIFEEIEDSCVVKYGNSRLFAPECFAELKKKYTGVDK